MTEETGRAARAITGTGTQVPDYAAPLGADRYRYLSRQWHSHYGVEYDKVTDAQEVAALIMIIAVEANDEQARYLNYDMQGYPTSPAGQISQGACHRRNVFVPGMEEAVTRRFDLEKHGIKAFSNLATLASAAGHAPWTSATVSRLLEIASQIPVNDFTRDDTQDAPVFQAGESVLGTTLYHLREHPDDQGVKAQAARFCTRLLQEADPGQPGTRMLLRSIAPVFEEAASDEEIAAYGALRSRLFGPVRQDQIALLRGLYPRLSAGLTAD